MSDDLNAEKVTAMIARRIVEGAYLRYLAKNELMDTKARQLDYEAGMAIGMQISKLMGKLETQVENGVKI